MNIYGIMAIVLTSALCGVFWKLADFISTATRWIEHDLKMRRGNR